MSNLMTIHVLGFGELYQHVLNALASFMKQDGFFSLLKLTSLIGIIMASVGYLKERNPFCYGKWFLGYVLVCNVAILPKMPVMIYDISAQKSIVVNNVPVVFATTASLITSVGVSLAESYDALLTLPDDLTYTKTGSLFGARMIQAARDFKIMDAELKCEMNAYFRNCVVIDIALNHKYSVGDLSTHLHLWDLISQKPSELRMTPINGKPMTCKDATFQLKLKLDAEIKKAYSFFGINLFGKAKETNYEKLFDIHLASSFNYYQHMTDTAANIFLQSMMINAMGDGIKEYHAFTDSTAGVLNYQVSKSKVQHRWSWAVAGQKAAWFLPMLHALLTLLLFGLFPIILVMATLPKGSLIMRGYLQFFISLQFWPVLFAILNAAMTFYGASLSNQYGGLNLVNIERLDELHGDLSGVAGYLMLLIPFLAKGLVSNLSDAFNNLATSMSSHLQGSAMAVAGEAAAASFSLGQTSFYNTSANNFSANKHDSNWTHLHGMQTEQLDSGALKTLTGQGDTVFDVSPGITKGAVSLHTSEALTDSLNQAYESSRQAALNESQHMQTALSNFAHRTVQLSQLQGHDLRLGHGVSQSDSSQYSKALSTMNNIASDVAHRLGVSTEEALQRLTSADISFHAGTSSDRSILGTVVKKTIGWNAGTDVHTRGSRTSTSNDRLHEGSDTSESSRQAADFHQALNYVNHFVATHHFDENHSNAAQLSNQLGADLREAETASRNYDVSLSQSERIQHAKSYVESNSAEVNIDLNQEFPAFVAERVGEAIRDQWFAHPGDSNALHQLQSLAHAFVAHKRDVLIADFGTACPAGQVDAFYHHHTNGVIAKGADLGASFKRNQTSLVKEAQDLMIGIDDSTIKKLNKSTDDQIKNSKEVINEGEVFIGKINGEVFERANHVIEKGTHDAKRGAVLFPTKEK